MLASPPLGPVWVFEASVCLIFFTVPPSCWSLRATGDEPPSPVLDTCKAGGLGTGWGLRGPEGRLGRPPPPAHLANEGNLQHAQSQLLGNG